jgi:hypothetical protein
MVPAKRENGMPARGPATTCDIISWQAKLTAIVLETIDEEEIREVLKAILKKAKEGDLAAARLILGYAVGSPPKRGRDPVDAPTASRPGSNAKLDVLAYRQAHGLPLHSNGDKHDHE